MSSRLIYRGDSYRLRYQNALYRANTKEQINSARSLVRKIEDINSNEDSRGIKFVNHTVPHELPRSPIDNYDILSAM